MADFWRGEALTSLDNYRRGVLVTCAQADRAFRGGDECTLVQLQERMYSSKARIPEHYMDAYHYGICEVTLLLALCCSVRGDFESVITLCHTVDMIRHFAERERISEGRGPHPLSVTLTTEINALGECKWQCDERYRDRVMTPEEMAGRWHDLMKRVPQFAADKFGASSTRYQDCMERLAWSGLQVAKTLYRYRRDLVPEFVAYFNGRFGPTLECGPGDYCYKPLAADDPKYWDFELAKLIIDGKLTDGDERYIRQRRRETYLQCVPANDAVISFDNDAEFARWRGLKLVSA